MWDTEAKSHLLTLLFTPKAISIEKYKDLRISRLERELEMCSVDTHINIF